MPEGAPAAPAVPATPATPVAASVPDSSDTGLGFGEFLSRGSSKESAAETPATPAAESTPAAKVADGEAKADSKATNSKGSDKEAGLKAKAEGGSVADKAKAGDAETPPAAPNWDDEGNPYKKRYNDTHSWSTRINQELVETRRQLETVNQKLDGTYDEEAAKAARTPSPEQIAYGAALQERVDSSVRLAYQQHGKEKVDSLVFNDGAPFRAYDQDQAVQARVMASPSPTLEAMKFLEEEAFFEKWGRDATAIEGKVRKASDDEWNTKIDAEVEKRINERLKIKDKETPRLATVRGSADKKPDGEPETRVNRLSDIFNPGLSA